VALWEDVANDANDVESGARAGVLFATPLWRQGMPRWARYAWRRIRRSLEMEQDWEAWIGWYDDRVAGRLRSEAQEFLFAQVPIEKWDSGYAVANLWIKDHMRKSGEPNTWNRASSSGAVKEKPNLRSSANLGVKGHTFGKSADSFPDGRIAKPPSKRVFLSHSHKDKRFARLLARSLTRRGIFVWLDEAEINIGDSLIDKLRLAIDEVDFVIAVISSFSVASEWVKKELDIAMNHEIKTKRIKVLPILIDDSNLPGFLEGKLFGDFRDIKSRAKSLDRLIASIYASAA